MEHSNSLEIYIKYCEELWSQCMETERQRSQVSMTVVFSTTAALIGIGVSTSNFISMILSSLIVLIGFYGFFINYKLYERWSFTRNRLHHFYDLLDSKYHVEIINTVKLADLNYHHPARNIGTQIFRHIFSLFCIIIGIIMILNSIN